MANIALDYDGTYTDDPELWRSFVNAARNRGHAIYVVTMRYPNEEITWELSEIVDGVIYTSRNFKQDFVNKMSLQIDIWIDDNPMWITGSIDIIKPR